MRATSFDGTPSAQQNVPSHGPIHWFGEADFWTMTIGQIQHLTMSAPTADTCSKSVTTLRLLVLSVRDVSTENSFM